MSTVCVFGASGFVGRAMVERLIARADVGVVAAIHRTGSAWPILRHGIPLTQADLGVPSTIRAALEDVDVVVNLALGPMDEAETHLNNLIRACVEEGVQRLVHLSSVSVYGDPPHPDSASEGGPVLAEKGTYGWYKHRQDLLIEKAHDDGLSCVVLCPPHITGPYGRIFHRVVDAIAIDAFALVDGGEHPCNLVDVNNLCRAIELAMEVESSDGRRMFVTNGDDFTWADLARLAAPLAGKTFSDVPRVTGEQARAIGGSDLSVVQLAKALARSAEVRGMVKQSALVRNKALFGAIRWMYRRYGKKAGGVGAPPGSATGPNLDHVNESLAKQQLRGVRHSIARARHALGYEPVLDSRQSFAIFESYYQDLYGYDTEYWDLATLAARAG